MNVKSKLLLVIIFTPLAVYQALAQQRPNIILIMADDMGFSDIGSYGGEVETPNLDSLAEGGLRFSQFYNAARCVPTRASLLTGLYSHQAGLGEMTTNDTSEKDGPGYRGEINRHCVTLAELLRGAGYSNYMTGKWHLVRYDHMRTNKENWPLQRGFDRFFGLIPGSSNFFTGVRSDGDAHIASGNNYIPVHDDFYFTNDISDTAVTFIDEHISKGSSNPFFLYIAYTAPHWPLHALKKDIDKYRNRYQGGWEALRNERYNRMKAMGLVKDHWDISPQAAPSWGNLSQAKKDEMALRMAIYAAQIDCMDQGIGRVIKALKSNQIWDNTLILFLSDNGASNEGGDLGRGAEDLETKNGTNSSYGKAWANASDTPFRYFKKYTHEGGISTPLIAHWPTGIARKGEWEHQTGHIIDIMPLFVELSGAHYPRAYRGNLITPMEGVSLLSAFENRDINRGKPLFWEHFGRRAVRDGKWKMVSRGKNNPWELYDMEVDRTELNNLADANTAQITKMSDAYDNWANRTYVTKKSVTFPDTLEVVTPNGGEQWVAGSKKQITWGAMGKAQSSVKIEFNTGGNWETITDSTPHTGTFTWRLPNIVSSKTKIRISSAGGTYSDESNGTFEIVRTPTPINNQVRANRFPAEIRITGLEIRVKISQEGPYTLNLLTLDGKSMGERTGSEPREFAFTSLPPGNIYLVNIKIGKNTYTGRLVLF